MRHAGLHISVVLAPGIYIGHTNAPGTRMAGRTVVVAEEAAHYRAGGGPHQRLAMAYLEHLSMGRFDQGPVLAPMDWGGHVCGGPEPAELGGGSPALDDWACGQGFNSERLEGTVTASTFFIESDGSADADLYTWTSEAIEQVKLQVIDAWNIWSYTAAQHGVPLTAYMDWHVPADGLVVQGYEPVLHPASQDHLWLDAIMHNAGRTEVGTSAMLRAFAHERRMTFGTDHAFNAFFAYNPPAAGAPSQFTDGRIGYAMHGGPYAQLLYKANGWAVEQIARVYGHELAHVFHAFDEYAGAGSNNCARSFNGRQNLNHHGGACQGNAPCVMVDNSFVGSGATRRWNMCAHTPVHLGWSSTLVPPAPLAPVNELVLTSGQVEFSWSAGSWPVGTQKYLRVMDRDTRATVHCMSVDQGTSTTLTLLNGHYRWSLGAGVPDVFNGYAGMISEEGQFTVDAPLSARFSPSTLQVCPDGGVVFEQECTGAPSSWSWSFPGGVPSSYAGPVPPVVQYPTPGQYSASLTISDGAGMASYLIPTNITVLGGQAVPSVTDMEQGLFPPPGWTTPVAPGSIPWTSEWTVGCSSGVSAYVNAFPLSGTWRTVRLIGPMIDLREAQEPYVRFRYSYAQETATTTEVLMITASDCGGGHTRQLFESAGSELATNGGGYVAGVSWQPSDCSHWKEVVLPVGDFAGGMLRLTFEVSTRGGQNLWLDDVEVYSATPLPLKALLEGPYDPGSGLMSDALRVQGLLPLDEPYSVLGLQPDQESQAGIVPAVLQVSGPDAIVDWVSVELRDPLAPLVVRSRRWALLQRDGDVVGLDGVRPLGFPFPTGEYYIAIRHRNHLGVMTATPVLIGPGQSLDLTAPATTVWGSQARKTLAGLSLLWAGDANFDGVLRYTGSDNDRDAQLVRIGGSMPTSMVQGYFPEDVNLDGWVKYTGAANDRDRILQNLGGMPTDIRLQQVP